VHIDNFKVLGRGVTMDIHDLTIHEVLIDGVKKFSPFLPPEEVPLVGIHITVYGHIVNTFLVLGKVFVGKIDEFVQIIAEPYFDEEVIVIGFKVLEQYGLIIIEGEYFRPTEKMLRRFR